MKACFHRKFGGAEVLEVGTLPKPSNPGPNEVLIKVYAASLNPADFKVRNGAQRALLSFNFPTIVGFDFSGEILEIGADVDQSKFKPGVNVFGMTKGVSRGTVAEYIIVNESICAIKPNNVTHIEAASIPLVGITAIMAFEECLALKSADEQNTLGRTFISGGSGGVGSIAIQIAKFHYHSPYVVTSASPGAKTDFVTNIGADHVLNYKENPVQQSLLTLEPFDTIFDCVGDANVQLAHSLKKNSKAGMVSIDAAPTVQSIRNWIVNANVLENQRMTPGVYSFLHSSIGGWILNNATGAGSIKRYCSKINAHYEAVIGTGNGRIMNILSSLLKEGKIKGIIDKVYTLDDACEAFKHIESGRTTGKVVIEIAK